MISQKMIFHAPIETVYQNYADVKKWEYALSDVLNTKVLYDDGYNQEFLMTVERNFKSETVRSIRFCKPNEQIELFQPEPPPKIKEMRGLWQFKKIESNLTEVYATREFQMKDSYQLEQKVYEQQLDHYLQQNLLFFKAFAENKGKIKVSRFIAAGVEEIKQCFWDIQRWYDIWSPIEEVKVNFDDGKLQIFTMKVWRNDICEEVQTVRKKVSENKIEFSSPVPPPKLLTHTGSWVFTETDKGVIVTAEREFEMDPSQLDQDPSEALKLYKYNLQNRLILILESFVSYYKKEESKSCNLLT